MSTTAKRCPQKRDIYLAHYFRIAAMHCGPCLTDIRNGGPRRVDEIGLKATVKLREIFRNEPKPGLVEALAFMGKRWTSGWSVFEDRVFTIRATYTEGALFRAQAA